MNNIVKFAALNTKIRVLSRNILSDYDYKEILKKKNVNRVLDYLKNNTKYNFDFGDEYNLDKVEICFQKNLINQYSKIMSFLPIKYKKIFKALLVRYEIENIKKRIRLIDNGEKNTFENKINSKYFQINIDTEKNYYKLSEFIETLKNTPYYKILKNHLNQKNRLFYMEMSLDIYYFNNLEKKIKKILKKNKKNTILEVLGKNSDLLNIQWIYRALKYYELNSEELMNYVLLTGYHFKYDKLKALCYSKSVNEFIKRVKNSEYHFIFDKDEDFELAMEKNVEKYIYHLFKKLNQANDMDFNKAIYYLHQVEYEMRDLFTILESKKYNLENKKIKDLLVREF